MAKSSQTLSVNVEFNAVTSQLEKSVKNIRNLLNEWDFSKADELTLNKTLTQAETLITKFKAQTADGILGESGLKQNQNTIEKLNLLSKELGIKINQIKQNSPNILSKVDTSALERANTLIGTYNTKLSNNKNTEKIKQLNEELGKQKGTLKQLNEKAGEYKKGLSSITWSTGSKTSRNSIINKGKSLGNDSLKDSIKLLEEYDSKFDELQSQLKTARTSNLIDTTQDEKDVAKLRASLDEIYSRKEKEGIKQPTRTKEYKEEKSKLDAAEANLTLKQERNTTLENSGEIQVAKNKISEFEESAKKAAEEIKQAYQNAYDSIQTNIQKTVTKQEQLENSINLEKELKPSQQAIQQIAEGIKQIPQFSNAFDGLDTSTMTMEELENAISKTVNGMNTFEQKTDEITDTTRGMSRSLDQAAQQNQEYTNSLSQMVSSQRQIEDAFSNVAYFFNIANAAQYARRLIQSVYETVKELDEAMTETAVVTDFSVGDMWDALPEYTNLAKKYGASIKDAYDVMTLYYQQGLDTNETMALGQETMQMARIASLDYTEATDRMTNALRGFNMELNETSAQRVNDVYSELAAISASDVDELSNAMTKTASIANSANMSFENTAAFLAQIIETTRESSETAQYTRPISTI